jgi:hypothetical protein
VPFDFLKPKQRQQQNNAQANNNLGGNRYPTDLLLGELMVQANVITQTQLDDAVKLSANKHLQLGQMLIMAGNISPRDLQAAVDAQSMLRDRSVDQPTAAKCLKIACKTGMTFSDVYRDQIGQRSDSSTNKLGELLLDARLIDREQFGKAMQRSLATGLPLGRILVLNGAISEHILTESLEIQVRIRDGMLDRMEAVTALRAQIGDFDSEELQRQTMPFKAALLEVPRRKGVRLGELLVMAGLLAETDVMSALEIGLLQDQRIGQVFIAQGFVTEELLDIALELQQKVDQEVLQPLEAGQALAKISATGASVDESIEDFVKPKEQVYEPLSFDKMLVLARVISSDDIEAALEQVLQSPQLLAQLLIMTNFLEEHTSSAVLQCYSMMSNNFLSQDDAIIALDYCLNKEAERNITFGEALSELGWSATQSLQIHAKNSVDITHIRLQAMLGPEAKESLSDDNQQEEAQMSMEDYARSEEMAASERYNQSQQPDGAQGEQYQEQQYQEQQHQGQQYQEQQYQEQQPLDQQSQAPEYQEQQSQQPEYQEQQYQEQQPLDQQYQDPQQQDEYSDEQSQHQGYAEQQNVAYADGGTGYAEPQGAQAGESIEHQTFDIDEQAAQPAEAWEQPDSVAAESYADPPVYGTTDSELPPGQDEYGQSVSEAESVAAVAQEDAAYREEFDLQATDIVEQTEIAAPAEPEDMTPQSAASLPGGLMGSLSSLLSNGEEAPPKQAKSENSLGQMMASTNTVSDPATSSDSEVGALRDLFAPQSSGDVAPAAAPANGKNTSHEENSDALVAVAAENSQQAVAAQESAPVSKGLGGLMRTPANVPAAAESPVARGTDNGADVTDAAGGASSLSAVLAKASTSTPGINKFVGGTRGTPVSTGALSPLSVPSIDRGNSLLKPEEPYDPADLHKIGAIGSVGTTGGTTGSAKGAADTGEIVGAVPVLNAGMPKSEVELAFNAQSFESQPTVEEPEVPPHPTSKSTSAFAHLVASAPKKSAEAIAETIDVESSNERVESVVDKYPAEVPGATAPAMPNPTPAAFATTEATPAPPPASHVPQSLSSTLKDMVPADPSMQLNPNRDSIATPPTPVVDPTLREMEPASIPPAAALASPAAPAASKLARIPSDQTLEPIDSPVAAAPAPVSKPAPIPVSTAAPAPAAMPTPTASVAPAVESTSMQPAPVAAPAAAAQPAPPQSAPAPVPAPALMHGGNSDNVTTSSESPETKTEVKEALGSALNRLAESYYQQGNYPEAQGLYEKILSLRQQQIGPKNPALGADLTNLAGVLCVQGKFAQAEPFVRRVVTLIEATEPVDVLKLAGSINTLAGILFQQGKLEECEPLLGRALQLRKEFLGEDVIEVADSLRDYAKLLKKLGRIEEAEKHYLQAKAIVARRQQAAMTPPA